MIRRSEDRVRRYPACCTSAYCGDGGEGCPTCPNYPRLVEFRRWREATKAVQTDRIWSPSFWTATEGA